MSLSLHKRSFIAAFGIFLFFIGAMFYFGYKFMNAIELILPQNEALFSSAQQDSFDMKTELKHLLLVHYNTYFHVLYNDNGVERLERLISESKSWGDRAILQSELAYQLLLSDHPDKSIELIEELNKNKISLTYAAAFQYLVTKLQKHQVGHVSLFRNSFNDYRMQIALNHLRIGEQKNCQINHTPESCILPFSTPAFHLDDAGSRKAIEYLEGAPGSVARWLLNIAHHTLGQYPSRIHSMELIDFSKYESKSIGLHFANIAIAAGVNHNGYYGGAIIEDFNNDGLLDIFTTSGRLEDNVTLYYNNGDGTYSASTNESLSGITGGVHAMQADYDNDGFTDIFILRGGWMEHHLHPVSLLRNNGDGSFTDVTHASGLLTYFPSHTAAWFDFNLDGHLDLFVGNERGYSILYENRKDGSFKALPDSCLNLNAMVKGCFAADFNNDGLPDLYVSCFNSANRLYMNRGKKNGAYHFEEIAKKAGVDQPVKSFPAAVFDFNNDGYMDIFCTSYLKSMKLIADQYTGKQSDFEQPALYLNNGDETFTRLSSANLNRSLMAMGMNFGDIDNDGYMDVYMGTGFPEYEGLIPNLMFRNREGKDWEDVTLSTRLGHLQKGHGIAFGDLNRDGSQDIYASMGGFYRADNFDNALFMNSGNENNWAVLKLEGSASNRSAIGAKVKIWITEPGKESRMINREINSGGSYGSSPLQLHAGLGKAMRIDKIEVHWPASGIIQKFHDIEVNAAYKIMEDKYEIIRLDYHPVLLKTEISSDIIPIHHH